MRTWFIKGLLVLTLAACGNVFSATQQDQLSDALKNATGQDNATGAGMLCTGINQAIMNANAKRSNNDELRHWEQILHDAQGMVANMKSAEATATFVKSFTRMPPQGQAILALGLRSHPPSNDITQACIKLLKASGALQVQVACMDLLGAHKAKEGIPSILKDLNVNKLVSNQIAACRALANIGDKEAIEPLIEFLRKWRHSRMRYEATHALRTITGMTFSEDASTWSGWWERNRDTFNPLTNVNPTFNYELEVTPEEGKEPVTYYEIPIIENRIIFLMDISGSMQLGGAPNRMEKARAELKNLISRLDPKTLFNIVLFNNKVERWNSQGLVAATDVSKQAAHLFLDKASPSGGTATMDALEEALYQIAFINGVETIFLVSDGVPHPMKHSGRPSVNMLPKGNMDIQRRIRYINQTLKVRINTIGVYTGAEGGASGSTDLMKGFLEGVAKENDGVYKEVN